MDTTLEYIIRDLLKSVLLEVVQEVLPVHHPRTEVSPNPHPGEPMLLRPKEAAKAMSISERTLFELTRTGQIPSVRIGRLVRYSSEGVEGVDA
jgi:excisionase family DNA binding protein